MVSECESCPEEVNGHAKPAWKSVVWSQASALMGWGRSLGKALESSKQYLGVREHTWALVSIPEKMTGEREKE